MDNFNDIKKAAEQGDGEAQLKLADMYMIGEGVTKNFLEGMKWIRLSAEQGFARAQYILGNSQHTIEGIENYAQATYWYKLAADQGDIEAQYNLGTFYMYGKDGVPQNFTEAFRLFSLAADQGDGRAQHALGIMFEEGYGVTTNYTEAAKWYTLSADQGFLLAKEDLEKMKNKPEAKAKTKADAKARTEADPKTRKSKADEELKARKSKPEHIQKLDDAIQELKKYSKD